MTNPPRYHLYVDDSGCRYSDKPQTPRADGMDYFALGGVLIDEADVTAVQAAHKKFVSRWDLTAELHSTKIRGRRGPFSWLSIDEERANAFLTELESFILDSPIVCIACVIDRPGYVARYADKYPKPWLLCQTAFAILVERASKYARERDGRLAVYFEKAGKKEDRAIASYMRELKSVGMPFSGSAAAGYESLSAPEFRAILQGEPNRVTKAVPMIQLADLVLYAMARGGYEERYPPFRALHARGRTIDTRLKPEDMPELRSQIQLLRYEKGPE